MVYREFLHPGNSPPGLSFGYAPRVSGPGAGEEFVFVYLNQAVEVFGYHRKSAIRALGARARPAWPRPGRPPKYDAAAHPVAQTNGEASAETSTGRILSGFFLHRFRILSRFFLHSEDRQLFCF